MIKAAFFDIDGTLISFNTHLIPDSTINAIKKLRQQGTKRKYLLPQEGLYS